MIRFALLATAALLPIASPAAPAVPAAVTKALAACLRSPTQPPETGRRLPERPQGLIGSDPVEAVALPGSNGLAVAYVGEGRSVVSCGVALYGPVAPRLIRALRRTIETNEPSMRRQPVDRYRVDTSGAAASYWGDVRAGGLIGVIMLVRKPGVHAPTLEVQYHSILLR